MNSLQLHITEWQFWQPDWHPQSDQPVPVALRRRMTTLGRNALALSWAMTPNETLYYLFSSRHGDFERTHAMLSAMAEEDELSPAEFSLSVHNALCGLLSIATGNRHGHLALSAGRDTFGCALLEGGLLLQENPDRPVLLVYYDAPLPDHYAQAGRIDEPTVAATFLLTSPRSDQESISMRWLPVRHCPQAIQPPSLAECFLHFLQSGTETTWLLGERWCWHWQAMHE
ncbi:MAG: beta-ketoacyl synthase chain length factor [Magnetococcales bacterium]|nr:beta-ketoacyl synthase chain length factor [Magnetococcales bacterium]MBF0114081.1 beta-ketoacyl synthase chain length factor [Magnetococcales bacterium]